MWQNHTAGRATSLATEVLTLSHNTLLVHLRFLDMALSRFTPEASRRTESLATDGRTLYYDPRYILRSYQTERTVPARDYLHLVLHCVFRHFCIPEGTDREIWNLACDIAVEHAIWELNLPAVSAAREQRQKKVRARLLETAGLLTAEKLYRYYQNQGLSRAELEELRTLFRADDHELWQESDVVSGDEWRDLSRRMQVDLETFARQRGYSASALMSGLREVNRQNSNYAGFLRKFAARGEPMKLDADEFDYSLYSYGLQLYGGRVPLIEQVEYRETRRVREFVVVTAFSEAFSAETAQKLLDKTRAGLTASESALSKVNLQILSVETDARKTFQAVDEMLRRGEIVNMKGLLVLTDGRAALMVVDINVDHVPERLYDDERILNGFLSSVPRGYGEQDLSWLVLQMEKAVGLDPVEFMREV